MSTGYLGGGGGTPLASGPRGQQRRARTAGSVKRARRPRYKQMQWGRPKGKGKGKGTGRPPANAYKWNDDTRVTGAAGIDQPYEHPAERGSVKWTQAGWRTGGGFTIAAYDDWRYANKGRTEVTTAVVTKSDDFKPWRAGMNGTQGSVAASPKPHRGARDYPAHPLRGDPKHTSRNYRSVTSAFGSTMRMSKQQLAQRLSTPPGGASRGSSRGSGRAARATASPHGSAGQSRSRKAPAATPTYRGSPLVSGAATPTTGPDAEPAPPLSSAGVTDQSNPVHLSVFAINNGRDFLGGSTHIGVSDDQERAWTPTMGASRSGLRVAATGRRTQLVSDPLAETATLDAHHLLPQRDARDNTKAQLSTSRSQPAFSIGVRLKTRREIDEAIGFNMTPAPGGNVSVPSFAREAEAGNKGVQFGHRLASAAEIAERLGFLATPAPGGSTKVPSFVRENLTKGAGVSIGPGRPKSRPGSRRSAGAARGPGGGSHGGSGSDDDSDLGERSRIERNLAWMRPSDDPVGRQGTWQGYEDKRMGAGITWGSNPGGELPFRPPSFAELGLRGNRGVTFASGRPKSREPETTPAPGDHDQPSFVEINLAEGRGVKFGKKLKTAQELLEASGSYVHHAGPIYNTRKPVPDPWDPPVSIYGEAPGLLFAGPST